MDTKKAIAEAAREMRKISDKVGRDLSALRDDPAYSHEEGRAIQRKALMIAEEGRQAMRSVRRDVFEKMEGYIPETRSESYIAPNGYVMRRMVQAPQKVEVDTFQNEYCLLIEKYTTEAGWDRQRLFVPGQVQKRLLKLNCSSCRKPTYAWTTDKLEHGQKFCASCLSRHLAKSH